MTELGGPAQQLIYRGAPHGLDFHPEYAGTKNASDRALAKAYGPRRLGILQTRAEILDGKGDREGARRVLTQAIAEAEALPASQRPENMLANLRKRLEKLSG